jgi:hypothetical protein
VKRDGAGRLGAIVAEKPNKHKTYRLRHPDRVQRIKEAYYATPGPTPNEGQLWSREDEAQIMPKDHLPDRKLARLLGRTVHAIQSHRQEVLRRKRKIKHRR